ncbi:MAG TPA: Rpn family recombination-promoting nuclease/putative transposase [Candidatus Enterocloster faecavium]|uniref:Rpn family recombination-promoting nuclease/putative transposase n=1 Tax=Candidatus Enterocloster faecavium TaxID=2838560 RepID=A0A9D2L8P6_9FIRM|nr:Rpn family recombination-promoting nuclease/putative transposase [Candidatus Enterocloster faecavium]
MFDPLQYPGRLEDFLSLCLGEEVKILSALPTESSRLTDEGSLLVMDLLVRLQSGALAKVEIQRVGYLFPGQRCACYSSDLVMRQYSMVRSQCRKENRAFSYQQIQKVYTIVLFQHSPKEFRQFPGEYLHHARQQFDTGLELDLLQEYLMIPLDIFLKSQHNISKKLDAWLMLIASDNMEQIRNVINAYPEFGEIYYQVFQFCRKVEELMNMYSDALRILDANTVKYMIEQQAEEIEQQKEKIDQLDQEMQSKEAAYRTTLSEKEQEIERLTALLEARDDNVKNT